MSWWQGERTAIDIADENHGTLQGGATFAPGKVGQAFRFDAVGDFVSVPHAANQNIQQALTVDAWVMKRGACEELNCFIVMKQNGISPCCDDARYGLFIDDNPFDTNSGKATLSFNTGEWEDVVRSKTIIQDDVWYHIAGTYDGSAAKIYVNGVLENAVPWTGLIRASTAGPLFIGHVEAVPGQFDETFNGLIDEVEIFNRALSANEIRRIFQAGSAGKCTVKCDGRLATLLGTAGNDLLVGTPGPDVIAGLRGHDTIGGRGGKDVICGGPGNDDLYGEAGADRLFGERGNDFLHGAWGNDKLFGGAGNDTLQGGFSDDVLNGGADTDSCDGGAHVDGDAASNCESVLGVP